MDEFLKKRAERHIASLSDPLGTWKEAMAGASDDEIADALAAAREKIKDLLMRIGYLEGLQQGRAWNQPEREE